MCREDNLTHHFGTAVLCVRQEDVVQRGQVPIKARLERNACSSNGIVRKSGEDSRLERRVGHARSGLMNIGSV